MNDDIIQQAAKVIASFDLNIKVRTEREEMVRLPVTAEVGRAIAQALADAGLLPTETEWGVSRRCAPDCPAGPEHIDSEDFGGYESSARRFVASDPESLTLKSRNVSPWKDAS